MEGRELELWGSLKQQITGGHILTRAQLVCLAVGSPWLLTGRLTTVQSYGEATLRQLATWSRSSERPLPHSHVMKRWGLSNRAAFTAICSILQSQDCILQWFSQSCILRLLFGKTAPIISHWFTEWLQCSLNNHDKKSSKNGLLISLVCFMTIITMMGGLQSSHKPRTICIGFTTFLCVIPSN